MSIAGIVSLALAAETNYTFYDRLGRLVRSVTESGGFLNGVIYQYDEVGNIRSVTTDTGQEAAPSLSGVTPEFEFSLLYPKRSALVISGQNLLTTEEVSFINSSAIVRDFTATDTEIRADVIIAPRSPDGETTIKVTTLSGTASTTFDIYELSLDPENVIVQENESDTVAVGVIPTPGENLLLQIGDMTPGIANHPASVTVSSGEASFSVTGITNGTTLLDVGGGGYVSAYVSGPFSGDAAIGSRPVTVRWIYPGGSALFSNAVSIKWP